jgi:predicted lysophospholipase L1 biosynthesis ABC-type transport system permease subunit
MRIFILALCLALAGTAAASDAASDALTEDLPVDASTLLQNDEVSAANIRNLITLEQLHRSITSGTSASRSASPTSRISPTEPRSIRP